jgi:hypothetical protein
MSADKVKLHQKIPARAFFGEVDPVRRKKMRQSKEESRFHANGNGSKVSVPNSRSDVA